MIIPWVIAGIASIMAVVLLWHYRQQTAHIQSLESEKTQLEQTKTQVESACKAELERATLLRDNLLRATDDALLVLDADQEILFANPAAQSLLDPGGNASKTLDNIVKQPEISTLVQDAQMVGSEGMERRIELDAHILEARAVMTSSTNGTRPMSILSLRDVTHIQRLERARREMVSNITHELSTPITTIGLLAETLLNHQGKAKRMKKMAMDISREVDTLTQLVQEVRDLSLIESGQMPVRLTSTQLSTTVHASVEPLRALAESKEQSITLSIDDAILVLADDLQIQRAIKNIVHNAIKFSPEGGVIQISATADQDEATIAVTDEGPGIPADELPRIFERFYQIDRARRDGTGLGLAIVRHIVRAHGGRTWAESIEGQGATFYIALALADEKIQLPVNP